MDLIDGMLKRGRLVMDDAMVDDLIDGMLKRARLVREVLVCLLLVGALVIGIAVSIRIADAQERDRRPAYCFAGDARANADECRR